MSIPGALIPWITMQFFDNNGDPLDSGMVYAYETGTTTPKDTFSDSTLSPSSANTNPVVLDSAGRAIIFVETGGYDFVITDSNNVTIYTRQNVEDLASTFLSIIGTATGSTSVVSGYAVLDTDVLVTVDGTGGANPTVINLPAAADRNIPLTIKNLGNTPLAVTPNGSDTIDSLAAAYTVAAASTPMFPSVLLLSDGVSAWYIQASHG